MSAAAPRLTFMCVHAHPDDEAISTGGVLARYASEGVETVLVTCTNGELGDGPGGVKPGDPAHTGADVAARRAFELEKSCEALGIRHAEPLGYRDSGMAGWSQNSDPDAFARVDVSEAATRLASLLERFRPQVVVTYDENGFYGHPDHIQAHKVTVAAMDATGIGEKLYYPALPLSAITRIGQLLAAHGLEVPSALDDGDDAPFGTPDDDIGAIIDCSAFSEQKYASLSAHASQAENIVFLSLGPELFSQLFCEEAFVRARDRTGADGVEADLFSGLR